MFENMPDYHLEYEIGERWDEEKIEKVIPQLEAAFLAHHRAAAVE
jgi:hypothetical protein